MRTMELESLPGDKPAQQGQGMPIVEDADSILPSWDELMLECDRRPITRHQEWQVCGLENPIAA